MRIPPAASFALLGVIALPVATFAVPRAAAARTTVIIDATATREPISPYVYGQFIEHLGRCIYGGLWAEMLEDRKFYFPITANYDPYRGTRAVPEVRRTVSGVPSSPMADAA